MASVIVALPATADGPRRSRLAVARIFGQTPRIARRLDHRLLVRLLRQQLRDGEDEAPGPMAAALWTRTVGSTLCGELVDSALFYSIAFYGTLGH
jgi:hypothetical protein